MAILHTFLCLSIYFLIHTANASSLPEPGSFVRHQGHRRVARQVGLRRQSDPASSVDSGTLTDIETIHERRLTTIVEGVSGSAKSISSWLSTLGSDGKWPDSEVNYASGCDGQRANWPAQEHWQRISTMTAAWHGGLANGEQYVNDSTVASAISLAMDYWFANDFTNPACLDSGGTPTCPCGTPGFWNENWFSNIILIPELVSQTCLLLNDTLTTTQVSNCSHITLRAYGTFDHYVNGLGYLTGANTLDVAKIGIDQGLLAVNVSLITDAYTRIHETVVVEQAIKADGIRVDGSFSQHAGILYNGNYGKDFTNDVLNLETEAGGTQFAAGDVSKAAFGTLFNGDQWMIYRNIRTNVLHWDFSALGRFISFPVIDNQATGSIKINISQVQELGEQWQSSALLDFSTSLSKNTTDANAGELRGNRMFFDSDYMVTRGPGYVTSVKMYSNRTVNTECTNSQNLLGFHLSDGVVYTYLVGDEYEDIAAAWDWNLIPGSTVDYGATPLTCSKTQFTGIEAFVGGVTDGNIGAAAMRYTNPLTRSLSWQKAWFFLDDDVQHVMISDLSSTSNAPVFSVLDQRRLAGGVFVNNKGTQGGNFSDPQILWHGNVGYKFQSSNGSFSLSVDTGNRTGNWSSIGTSTQPPANVDLFSAWIDHKDTSKPISYTAFPGTDYGTFTLKQKTTQLQEVANNGSVSAIFDRRHNTAMAVFWDAAGGSFSFTPDDGRAPITITASGNAALIYRLDSGNVTVSDPSQTLTELTINMAAGDGLKPSGWGENESITLSFTLPTSGSAGSSISQILGH